MSAAAAAMNGTAPFVVSVEGVAKAFGETRALKACNLAIRPGSIHAVIGENGSGKSTLVKVLTGVVRPDSGTITLAGRGNAGLASPRAARQAGIATTFQEILVLEELSLLDNVWLGQDGLFRIHVASGRRRTEAAAMLSELLGGSLPDLDARMGDLDLGTRQAVVIARSLLLGPKLLILDEATAALDISVRDRLFAALRRRVAAGLSVLFITHKMDEIAALSDEVTVLRSGETVATLATAEATPARLLELMSGRTDAVPKPQTPAGAGAVRVAVQRVALAAEAAPFDLAVRKGEILGLAGLEGHGADLFAQVLGGVRVPLSGEICSEPGGAIRGQAEFVSNGISYVPRDRKLEGIFAPLSIADNFSISTLSRYTRLGLLDEGRAAAVRTPLFERLGVKYGALRNAITSLSGGNQQKVILARTLAQTPGVLVLNDPTRGVDLATKQDIYSLLLEQAAAGVSVVIHSTEIEELLALCHRVAVFHDSTLHGVLDRGRLTRDVLIAALFGRAP
jgi:ABC-type sugar transport system ATPase subunit